MFFLETALPSREPWLVVHQDRSQHFPSIKKDCPAVLFSMKIGRIASDCFMKFARAAEPPALVLKTVGLTLAKDSRRLWVAMLIRSSNMRISRFLPSPRFYAPFKEIAGIESLMSNNCSMTVETVEVAKRML